MAISYRSSSSANTGAASASSLAVNVPSGIVTGDIMVACVCSSNGSPVISNAPSGATWKTLISVQGSSGTNLCAYSRVVTGYEAASYTFTFASSCQASIVIADYSGASNFTPVAYGSASTGTASTTTVNSAPTASYFSGQTVQCFGAMNATAASTMTANGSYTQRADTCTTASQFVEACIQDVARASSITPTVANAATISQSATSTALTIFVENQRPAYYGGLLQDEAYANSWSSGSTSFTTPAFDLYTANYYNELVLACINIRDGSTTVSGITSSNSLTWVNVGRANTNAGSVEVWRAFAPTPGQFTITATMSGSTTSGDYVIVGIAGADMTGTSGSGAIGAVTTGTSSSAAPTISLTTTRNNSWVWGAANDPSHATVFVAGSSQTLVRTSTDGTNVCSDGFGQQTATTPTSGTNVTMNFTAPTVDSCNILAFEILPALHYNLAATGAG